MFGIREAKEQVGKRGARGGWVWREWDDEFEFGSEREWWGKRKVLRLVSFVSSDSVLRQNATLSLRWSTCSQPTPASGLLTHSSSASRLARPSLRLFLRFASFTLFLGEASDDPSHVRAHVLTVAIAAISSAPSRIYWMMSLRPMSSSTFMKESQSSRRLIPSSPTSRPRRRKPR